MKPLKLIFIVCAALIMQSCIKTGDIKVQNNISGVKISDVEWGNEYIASELLPGESSDKIKVGEYDEKLPSRHKISFTMTANNKSIYLKTEESFLLEEDDYLLIILTDETKVSNPNE